ncbi:hypothetical protein PV327_008919 [Microctonus hyperodae]|uniref:Uncharacterized protein n=1 Tax=Microctonus hyperodae TaxID=165561 RepID=A0AA39FSP4_MICHY|nr:hypothetical protein PV327_008919 [Microctonus hyperodae]
MYDFHQTLNHNVQGEFLTSFNNATDHGSSWRSGRLMRSLADEMPSELYIYIDDGIENTVILTFVRTFHKLANLHLPVDAPANYFFRDTIMNEIGEFVMYQDLASSSAIVYFEKLEAIVNLKMSITFDKTYKVEWMIDTDIETGPKMDRAFNREPLDIVPNE